MTMDNKTSSLVDGQYSLRDLIKVDRMQSIFDTLTKATGFSVALVTHPEQEIIVASGWPDLCQRFHRQHPHSRELCISSNLALTMDLKQLKDKSVKICQHGLLTGATPFVVKGVHLGNLLAGLAFPEKPDVDAYRQRARKYGFDEDDYLDALSAVAIMDRKKIEDILGYLAETATTMSDVSLRNMLIRKNEARLVATLNSIAEAVITTDMDGLITHINPVAQELTGWAAHECLNKPLAEVFCLVNADSGENIENPVQIVIENGLMTSIADNTTLVSKNGSRYYIFDCAAPICDDDDIQLGVVLTFRDITKEYELRRGVEHTNALLRALFHQSQVPMLMVGLDGKVELFNKASAVFLGLQEQNILSKNIAELMSGVRLFDNKTDKELTEASAPLALAMEGFATTNLELRVINGQNETKYCIVDAVPIRNENGAVVAGLAVFPDTTGLKKAEQAFHKSQSRFSELTQMLPEAIFEADAELNILYANDKAFTLFGYTQEDFDHGLNGMDMLCEEEREKARRNIERRFAGEELSTLEYKGLRRDGTSFPMLLHMEPIVSEGSVTGFRGIIVDMTERKALEEQYLQAQKVESIGRLAGGVAHDLNNLLTPILGYSEILREEFSPKDARIGTIEEVISAGKKARDLVRQLLAFSRKQTMVLKPLDLNQTITSFEKLLRRTIRENIEMSIKLAPGSLMTVADIGQIEQVIMNLAINASDAMQEGGKLLFETSKEEYETTTTFMGNTIDAGKYIVLRLSDTGTGIDDETLANIFEPFYSTKGEGGTGLGLSTVYGIVKQHNGYILVDSKVGVGTTFSILLPAIETETSLKTEAKDVLPPVKALETILLAEDNTQVRQIAEIMLQRIGYSVVVAQSGEELLKQLATYDGPADLLLTDVIMPGMNGRELYAKVSSVFPNIKVLFMSGYTSDVIASQGVLGNGINLLMKPFSFDSLGTKLRSILDE